MTFYWRSVVTMALCRVVSEIFNVEKCRDLEIGVRGHWRSLKVVPIGRPRMFVLVLFSNFVPKEHRFWDIRLLSIHWPWNPGWGSLKVIENYTTQSGTRDFLLTFHSNHRPISHRFRDKQRCPSKIARKSPIFQSPCIYRRRWRVSWSELLGRPVTEVFWNGCFHYLMTWTRSQCSTAVRTVVRATQQVNGKWQ